MKESLIIFDFYFLFFGSLYLVIACFQHFCPVTFNFFKFSDNVKEILATLSGFFFWPEGVWFDTLEGARALSTFINGLLMYIKFIITRIYQVMLPLQIMFTHQITRSLQPG